MLYTRFNHAFFLYKSPNQNPFLSNTPNTHTRGYMLETVNFFGTDRES